MPKTSFYSGTGITSEKADAVESSANAAAQSAADAATSEANAATSEANALTSETNASSSAANALTSETNAATSEANALASATSAQNLEITSASFDTTDGTLTLTKANSGTVTTDLDGRFLTSYTEANDLSTAVTWADVPDENITESSVTQHQSAINAGVSITESQISNLQSYLTAETSHADVLVDGDFTSNGLMKRDGAGTYSVDTSTYLTTHQDITGKADLSGADFTGDVTTTGDLGINTTNPAHPLDVKGNVNVTYGTDPIYTTSPLLTNASNTTYSIAEITDIYYASVRSTINQSPLGAWNDNRRAVQILFNFNGTGHPTAGQKGWSSADQSVVGDFINDTYSSNDISTFQSSASAIFNGTYTLQTTIIDDILDGDYDHLVDYKVGINVDPATEALDVGGNIKASGTLATGGYTLASTDGTDGQALVTDGSGNVSFGDVTVDVSGKADLSGATFTGDVLFNDGVKAKFGTDSDLLIYHSDGEPSIIEDAGELGLLLKTNGNVFAVVTDTNESMITASPDGGVSLHYDGTNKVNVGENAVTISENLSVETGSNLSVGGGDLDVTGDIIVSGTVDGVDILARDGVLTSTTTTANNALPKAGGEVTGNINGFIDIRNFYNGLNHSSGGSQFLTTNYAYIGETFQYTHSGLGTKTIDVSLDILYYNVNYTNDAEMRFVLVAPDPSAETTVNLGTVVAKSNPASYMTQTEFSGDFTKYFSKYMGLAKSSDGTNSLGAIYLYYYNGTSNRTIIRTSTQSGAPNLGDTVYLHPFDWESSGTQIISPVYQIDGTTDSTVITRRDFQEHLGYFSSSVKVGVQVKETSSSENVVINELRGKLTRVGN
jgi:hypothetical protein